MFTFSSDSKVHLMARFPKELADLSHGRLAPEALMTGLSARGNRTDNHAPFGQARLALLDRVLSRHTDRANGGDVICELDAWYIGGGPEAADDERLLACEPAGVVQLLLFSDDRGRRPRSSLAGLRGTPTDGLAKGDCAAEGSV